MERTALSVEARGPSVRVSGGLRLRVLKDYRLSMSFSSEEVPEVVGTTAFLKN